MAQDCRRQHFANSVEIAQGHQGVVCLMLEEDCSPSFLPSKILRADEAAVFVVAVVAVVVMVLSFDNMMLISGAQKRWRRGGRFLEDQVCDEYGADEDEEDEQDAAATAQEAAEERVAALEKENSTLRSLNERLDGEVSALRGQRELAEAALELASHHSGDQLRDHAQAVERLEGVNQEVLGQLEEEQRQRIVSERATQTQREAHRNEVAAMQRRQQEELASERQQHQEILAQGLEPLATSNSDNAVLAEQAAAAERTSEELRGGRATTETGQLGAPTFNLDDTQASATPSNIKGSRTLDCPHDGVSGAGLPTRWFDHNDRKELYVVVRSNVDQCPTIVVPVQGAC
ncbi:hypothetical protein Esi_0106_0069 [Ectocarpus siliculosus]|uniref:Uncharacterized protein n=1 Tax=Ectocarpus siliculosus TaxID=2880 RepID=D7FHA0_ECTSI|nr:hypothetical protein Esi_0106_0069 [Ectocarpus siliculosus]|eukprot:CBJ28471.1 hypothetical protein Esi_0106_0069 [Ectocarpus siliculosus]